MIVHPKNKDSMNKLVSAAKYANAVLMHLYLIMNVMLI